VPEGGESNSRRMEVKIKGKKKTHNEEEFKILGITQNSKD
jgi:hypothetical protein